ncbi:tetratricopeptide repeat protein [bacterium]|jgi:tetratricopeptide (TPR) repeat protein|nr:tetratricopeptide repeat protein [bacterium]
MFSRIRIFIGFFLVLICQVSFSDEALDSFRKGEELLDAADYVPAAACFKTIAEDFPTHELVPVAYYNLGFAYFGSGEYDKAVSALRRMIKEFPEDNVTPLCYLLLADCYSAKKEYSQSNSIIDDAVNKYQNPDIKSQFIFKKAYNYYFAREYGNAVKILDSIISSPPSAEAKSQALFLKAFIYKKEGSAEKAVGILKELVSSSGNPILANKALFLIAEIYDESGNKMKAIENYRNVKTKQEVLSELAGRISVLRKQREEIWQKESSGRERSQITESLNKLTKEYREIDAEQDIGLVAYMRRCLCYRDMGSLYRDIILSDYIIENIEDEYYVKQAYKELIYCYFELGEVDRCLSIAGRMEKTFPKDEEVAIAFLTIGKRFFAGKKYGEAITEFSRCVENSSRPDIYSEAKALKAAAFIEQSDYKKASEIYSGIITDKDKHDPAIIPESLFGMGVCLNNEGKTDESVVYFDALIAEYPSDEYASRARREKANVFFAAGKYDEALQYYRDYLGKNPGSDDAPDILIQIGACLINLNRNDDAIKELSSIDKSRLNTEYKKVLVDFDIAQAYANKGDYEQTEKTMLDIIKNYPGSEVTKDCYSWLDKYYTGAGRNDAKVEMYLLAYNNAKTDGDKAKFKYRAAFLEQNMGKTESAFNKYIGIFSSGDDKSRYVCLSLKNLMDMAVEQKDENLKKQWMDMLKKSAVSESGKWKADIIAGAVINADIPDSGKKYLGISVRSAFQELSPWEIYIVSQTDILLGRYDDAGPLLEELISKNSDDRELVFMSRIGLSDILRARGKNSESLEEVKAALKMDIADAVDIPLEEARYKLAVTLMDNGDYEGSLEIWKKLLREAPEIRKPAVLYGIAGCYESSGQTDKALMNFRKISLLYGDDRDIASKALLKCVEILSGEGKREESRQCYEELLNDFADTDAAAKAKEEFNGKI